MVADVILTKVESARQAAEVGALAGKTVVVTDVSSVTKLQSLKRLPARLYWSERLRQL
jgi:hypothetical protein